MSILLYKYKRMNVLDSIRTVSVIVKKYSDKVNCYINFDSAQCVLKSDSTRCMLNVLKSVLRVLISS